MSPYLKLWKMYQERGEDFGALLSWHHENGFVFSTPEYFVMGRPVNKSLIESCGVHLSVSPAKPDCWYVHAMAGDISKSWDCLPYHLPYIAFERKEGNTLRLTIVKTERMKRLSHAIGNDTKTDPIRAAVLGDRV